MNSASIPTVACDLWHETREHVGSMAACRTHQARIVAISLIYLLHPHRSYISVQLPVPDEINYVRFKNNSERLLNILSVFRKMYNFT